MPLDACYSLDQTLRLLSIPSPTDYPRQVCGALVETLEGLGFSPRQLRKGGVVCPLGGEGRPLALAAHVDTLGLMVRAVKPDGRLAFTCLGGPSLQAVETENVTVITRGGQRYTGVVELRNASKHVNRELDSEKRDDTTLEILLDEEVSSREDVERLGIAVALACLAMMIFLDGWLVPFVFLASIGIAILINLGTNWFMGEISYITKALSAVLQLADLTDDLESLFVGFRTGVGEIHAAHAGHLGDQLFRELDGGDVADAVGEVAHFHHLLGDGVDDFLAAVADVDGPHAAGNGVKIGLAVDVGDAHPFALHINGGLEILVLGQVVPNVLFVQSDQFSFIVSHGAFLMKS